MLAIVPQIGYICVYLPVLGRINKIHKLKVWHGRAPSRPFISHAAPQSVEVGGEMRRRSFASEGRLPKATAKPPARARVPWPPFNGAQGLRPLPFVVDQKFEH